MSEPGILYGGRGGRGGYGSYARFGQLEVLIDARRVVGVEGTVISRIPDFSPHGTNYMDFLAGFPGTGFGGKLNAIKGQAVFRVADGFTGQGSPCMPQLPRPIVGAVTTVTVCLFHNPTVNCVYDRHSADASQYITLNTNATAKLQSRGPNATILQTGDGVALTEQPMLIVCVYNGANSVIRAQRALVASGDTGPLPNVQSLRWGSVFSSGADMNGWLGLCAFYRGVLRDDAILALEDFTNRDWRLGL